MTKMIFPSAAYACPKCGRGGGVLVGIIPPADIPVMRFGLPATYHRAESYLYDCPYCGRTTTPTRMPWLPVIRGGSHRLGKL